MKGPIHSITFPLADESASSWDTDNLQLPSYDVRTIKLTDRKALAQAIKDGHLTIEEVNGYLTVNGYPAFTQQEVNLA
jgi:hypothetical protein